MGTTHTKSLFSAKSIDRKMKVLNLISHNESEAKLEILNELNARPDAIEGVEAIEVNGDITDYNNLEKCAVILFKSKGDKILFKKLTSIIKTPVLEFEDFNFRAKKAKMATMAKKLVSQKPPRDDTVTMENRNRILKIEQRLDQLDLTVNAKLDMLLQQRPHKNE